MTRRIIAAILILLMGIFLQLIVGEILGFWISFALVALITSAFFLNFFELLVLAPLTVLFLNWQPAPSYEMTILAAFPFVAYLLRKALPYEPRLSNLLFVFAAVLVLYVAFGLPVIAAAPSVFLGELLAVMLFWVFAFKALEAAE